MPRPSLPSHTQGAEVTRMASAARIIQRTDREALESIKARAVEAKLYTLENGFSGTPCDPHLAITEWFNNGFHRMRRLDPEGTKVQILREAGAWVTINASPIAIGPDKS